MTKISLVDKRLKDSTLLANVGDANKIAFACFCRVLPLGGLSICRSIF